MKVLTGLLVAIVLTAFGSVDQKSAHITVRSGGKYVANIQVPHGADFEFVTRGKVQFVKLDGTTGAINSTVPEIRLVAGESQLSIDGEAPASALRTMFFDSTVEINVTHQSTEILNLAVDDADVEISYR